MAEFFNFHHHPFADTRTSTQPLSLKRCPYPRARPLAFAMRQKPGDLRPLRGRQIQPAGHLIGRLDPNCYKPILLHYAGFNRPALLRAIAERLGLESNSRCLPLLVRLQKHLLQLTSATNSLYPVLIIDDAQLLERESMLDLWRPDGQLR